jgi:hypothetical protein
MMTMTMIDAESLQLLRNDRRREANNGDDRGWCGARKIRRPVVVEGVADSLKTTATDYCLQR